MKGVDRGDFHFDLPEWEADQLPLFDVSFQDFAGGH
jgi:hypothetical protein